MLVFHIIIFLITLGSSKAEGRINSEQASINTEKCQELELKNGHLSEELSEIVKLNADENGLINELKAQVRELEQEKEDLKNEVQIMMAEVHM